MNRVVPLSRGIGENLPKQIMPPTLDMNNYVLNDDGQLVALSTDGSWGAFSDEEVAQCCLRMKERNDHTCLALDSQTATDAVRVLAAERCSRDDKSAVILDVRAAVCRKSPSFRR